MRKLISMLLAVSMSLSVMCSSFTVAAVDGNEAAQTEGSVTENTEQPNNGIGGLFGNEINEKVAALSNDCGISTVEVNGNTATVKYWADRDCTVIVGIYADDGTKGTHMVTFGTAQVKAAETEASVTIGNLPQYFYLKAYLVDSESYRPLAAVYDNAYYTKVMDDFDNLTISDFIEDGYDEDRIMNLDGSDSNNFMVLDKRTKVLNGNLQININDIRLTETALTVNQNANAEPDIENLKKGDPFLFYTENGVLAAIASDVSYNGTTAVINYKSAVTADVFDYITIDTSNITPAQSSTYSRSRADNSDTEPEVYPLEDKVIPLSEKFQTDPDNVLGASIEFALVISFIEGNVKISFADVMDDLIVELNIKPTYDFYVVGAGRISGSIKPVSFDIPIVGKKIGDVGITILGVNIALSITPKGEINTTLDVYVESPIQVKIDLNQDYADMFSSTFDCSDPNFNVSGSIDLSISVKPTLSLVFFKIQVGDVEKELGEAGIEFAGTLKAVVEKSIIELGEKIHDCKKCFPGELSIKFGINTYVKSDIVKMFVEKYGNPTVGDISIINDTIRKKLYERECLSEKYRKFHLQFDPLKFGWGECKNYSYRTYIDVVAEGDETAGNGIRSVYVNNQSELYGDGNAMAIHEARTNRGGTATIHINPYKNKYVVVSIVDGPCSSSENPDEPYYFRGLFEQTQLIIPISNPDEFKADQHFKKTVKLKAKPTEIRPYPEEALEVPQYQIGEKLRYTGLEVTYGTEAGARKFRFPITDNMIKSFDTSKAGEQTLQLEFNGREWSQQIEVIIGDLERVFLSPPLSKREYKIGEPFELGDAKLNAVYRDPNTGKLKIKGDIEITPDMVSGFDSSTVGEKQIVITYTDAKGNTADTSENPFIVTVIDEKREVESIEINTLPNKTEYAVGEALDISGLTIDVHFSDGTSETRQPVSMNMVSGFDSSTAGTKKVTVTYTDKYDNTAADDFTVTIVDESEIIEIKVDNVPYESRFCEVNKSPNLGGVMLTVIYGDGHEETIPVTQEMITCDTGKAGTTPVNVEYKGLATSYMIEVVEDAGAVIRGLEYSNQKIQEFDLESIVKMEQYYEGNGQYGWISNMDVWYTDGQIRKPISLNVNYFDGKEHETNKVNIPRCDSAIYWFPDSYKGPKLGVKVVGFDPLRTR